MTASAESTGRPSFISTATTTFWPRSWLPRAAATSMCRPPEKMPGCASLKTRPCPQGWRSHSSIDFEQPDEQGARSELAEARLQERPLMISAGVDRRPHLFRDYFQGNAAFKCYLPAYPPLPARSQ